MTRLLTAAGAFVLWAMLSSAPPAVLAQNGGGGNGGGCVAGGNINACNGPGAGQVGQTVVSSSPNGCTVIDDGNIDDPPAPGMNWDGDPDDAQIIAACPQLAPPPVAPPPVTAASCTAPPPHVWYNPSDPVHGIPSVAPNWAPQAQTFASRLFNILFLFEIFIIGLQAILYRHDISHFLSSFAFKTFVATFFIYLIAHSQSMLPSTLNSFNIAGATIAFPGTNQNASQNAGDNALGGMYEQDVKAATLFFCAAMASHIEDHATALEYGIFGNMPSLGHPGAIGSGDFGHTLQGATGHLVFEFLVQGLGMLVIAGAGIMFLSVLLVDAEAFISVFAGIFFLGFSSTRFSAPFTQGYLSYTVNVGVKLLTIWPLIAVNNTILMPVLNTAGNKLIGAASIQFGSGAEMYLLPASIDVALILAMASLMWFLPNILGRFVSGSSGLSAVKVVYGLASSLKSRSITLAGPGGALLPGTISPAHLLRGPVRVMPSKETFASVVAPMQRPSGGFGNAMAPAEQIVSPISPLSGAASVFASDINDVMNTDASRQPVQASVSDGPDPFAMTPKIAPITIHLQPQASKYSERSLAGTPMKTAADEFSKDAAMRSHSTPAQTFVMPPKAAVPESGSFTSPGFNHDLIRPKTSAAPQNAGVGSTPMPTSASNPQTSTSADAPSNASASPSPASLNAAPLRQTVVQSVSDTRNTRPATSQNVEMPTSSSASDRNSPPLSALPSNPQASKNRSVAFNRFTDEAESTDSSMIEQATTTVSEQCSVLEYSQTPVTEPIGTQTKTAAPAYHSISTGEQISPLTQLKALLAKSAFPKRGTQDKPGNEQHERDNADLGHAATDRTAGESA